jgi:hypothetical protein
VRQRPGYSADQCTISAPSWSRSSLTADPARTSKGQPRRVRWEGFSAYPGSREIDDAQPRELSTVQSFWGHAGLFNSSAGEHTHEPCAHSRGRVHSSNSALRGTSRDVVALTPKFGPGNVA